MHILLTGGGSGGHIFPNIALLKKLKSLDSSIRISYIGENDSMEKALITKENVPFYSIRAGKLRRYFSIQNMLDIGNVLVGIIQSFFLIKRLSPDVVFSKGGYVSLPVVIAAKLLRKRIVIHESDVYPGLTTKISSRFANTICVSWKKTLECFPGKNVVLTGIPVREELRKGVKERGYAFTGIEKNTLPTILVVGGSLGAGKINEFVKQHVDTLTDTYNIIHLVGRGKAFSLSVSPEKAQRYVQLEFVGDEMKDIFALTDIVLSRAGSTALAEFSFVHKPVIMIPLPRSQSRGDQYDNAKEYVRMWPEMGRMIEEEEMSVGMVLESLKGLSKPRTIDSSTSSATSIIISQLLATMQH